MPLLAPVITAVRSAMAEILSAPGPASGVQVLAYDQAVAELRAVITDWGGVMTNPIAESVNAWLEADGIDRASYVTVMRAWVSQAYAHGQDRNPITPLER